MPRSPSWTQVLLNLRYIAKHAFQQSLDQPDCFSIVVRPQVEAMSIVLRAYSTPKNEIPSVASETQSRDCRITCQQCTVIVRKNLRSAASLHVKISHFYESVWDKEGKVRFTLVTHISPHDPAGRGKYESRYTDDPYYVITRRKGS